MRSFAMGVKVVARVGAQISGASDYRNFKADVPFLGYEKYPVTC
jgi:hypothetical protein